MSRILKSLVDYMGVAISHLINCIFKYGIYPEKLKITRIIPLKKQGKPGTDLNSFRPINNLCPIDKVVEEAIRVRIDNHLVAHKMIPNNSHGARSNHSTLTAIQEVERSYKANKAAGETTAVLATDLTAAFDLIDHQRNLNTLGLGGHPTESLNLT